MITVEQFRAKFALLAEKELESKRFISPDLKNLLNYVFEDHMFAHGNGNRTSGASIIGLSALKTVCPAINTRIMSDVPKPDDYPTQRQLLKPVAEWIRCNLDPSLIVADPGAAMRRSLLHATPYDRNFGGSFADPTLGEVFLTLINLIEGGQSLEVFRGSLQHYKRMADSRRPVVQPHSSIDPRRAMRLVIEFVQVNPGERGQLVAWAVTNQADPTVTWNKTLTANDHNHVADLDGKDYAVELTSEYITLNKLQDVGQKAASLGKVRACHRRHHAFPSMRELATAPADQCQDRQAVSRGRRRNDDIQ